METIQLIQLADRDLIMPVPVGAQQFLETSNFSSVAATYNSESDEESPSQAQGIETNPRLMIPIETAQPVQQVQQVQQVPDEISMQPGNLTIPFETHQNYLLTAAKHGHWLLVRVLLDCPQSEQSDIDAYNHFLSDSMIEQHLLGAVAELYNEYKIILKPKPHNRGSPPKSNSIEINEVSKTIEKAFLHIWETLLMAFGDLYAARNGYTLISGETISGKENKDIAIADYTNRAWPRFKEHDMSFDITLPPLTLRQCSDNVSYAMIRLLVLNNIIEM